MLDSPGSHTPSTKASKEEDRHRAQRELPVPEEAKAPDLQSLDHDCAPTRRGTSERPCSRNGEFDAPPLTGGGECNHHWLHTRGEIEQQRVARARLDPPRRQTHAEPGEATTTSRARSTKMATSRPVRLRNLKLSATDLAAQYTFARYGSPAVSHSCRNNCITA